MEKLDVLKAFHNEIEEQVPFSVWRHFTPNEHVEATQENKMLEIDEQEEPKYVKSVNPDFIKLMNDGLFTYQFNKVENAQDLDSLAKIEPIADDDAWLRKQFDLISNQINLLDSSTVKFNNIFSAVTLFKWALVVKTPEKDLSIADHIFADLYIKDPQTVTKALHVINEDIKKQIRTEKAAGVDGVLFSTQEIQDSRIGKTFFDSVQKKLDTELIKEINNNFDTSILHICGFGEATNHLPWFIDYDLPIVNWATRVDGYSLSEGKKLFKNKVVFGGLGNTTDDVLFRGNQEQIQSEIDNLLDESGTTGVIIGADCTIPRETPIEHIKWAAQAVNSYPSRKKQV